MHSYQAYSPGKNRRGVAAVEFAALLPGILTLLVGIWEVGRLVEVQQVLSNAVREGGRQASTGQLDTNGVKTTITNCLKTAGMNTTNLTITVTNTTSSGKDPKDANYLDRLVISAEVPFSDVSWSFTSLILPSTQRLSARSEWISMLDRPFPNFPEPPVG